MKVKVCVIGVESTGKTTLCKVLVAHYSCLWVPEYARRYLQVKKNHAYTEKDLLTIAKGQHYEEEIAWKKSKQLLVCDTNLLTIKIWQEQKYSHTDPWIQRHWTLARYTHYFLTQTTSHWVADPLRECPDTTTRKSLHKCYEKALKKKVADEDWTLLTGHAEKKKQYAIKIIDRLLRHART